MYVEGVDTTLQPAAHETMRRKQDTQPKQRVKKMCASQRRGSTGESRCKPTKFCCRWCWGIRARILLERVLYWSLWHHIYTYGDAVVRYWVSAQIKFWIVKVYWDEFFLCYFTCMKRLNCPDSTIRTNG